jgi:hypothetical protein
MKLRPESVRQIGTIVSGDSWIRRLLAASTRSSVLNGVFDESLSNSDMGGARSTF